MSYGSLGLTNTACEPQYATAMEQAKACRMPTLKERLDHAVDQAEARLAAVKEAREIFSRNPDIERLLDIMQHGSF